MLDSGKLGTAHPRPSEAAAVELGRNDGGDGDSGGRGAIEGRGLRLQGLRNDGVGLRFLLAGAVPTQPVEHRIGFFDIGLVAGDSVRSRGSPVPSETMLVAVVVGGKPARIGVPASEFRMVRVRRCGRASSRPSRLPAELRSSCWDSDRDGLLRRLLREKRVPTAQASTESAGSTHRGEVRGAGIP